MMKQSIKEIAKQVITPEDATYEACKIGWNRGIAWEPAAIVYCQNEEEVKATIEFAKTNHLDLRIRSGGHHYEGYSSGDDVVILDVSQMNDIWIDEGQNKVTVQGGVRNEELYQALGAKGYPFPGGGCPTVGVAGFTLGGGWGYSARYLGLAIVALL